MAAFMNAQRVMLLDPAAFWGQLGGLGAGRDLGQLGNGASQGPMAPGTWRGGVGGVTDPNRSQVSSAAKQLLAQFNRGGLA